VNCEHDRRSTVIRTRRIAAIAILALLLAVPLAVPTWGADPSPASSARSGAGPLGPVGVGGRVEVPESGFALTLPDGWLWAVTTSGDIERLGSLLVALDPVRGPLLSGVLGEWSSVGEVPDLHAVAPVPPGGRIAESCWMDADPLSGESIDQRMADQAAGWSNLPGTTVTSTFPVDLPAGVAGRLDRVGPFAFPTGDATVEGSMYLLTGPSQEYALNCLAPDAPGDLWLSIAETLEILPPTSPSPSGTGPAGPTPAASPCDPTTQDPSGPGYFDCWRSARAHAVALVLATDPRFADLPDYEVLLRKAQSEFDLSLTVGSHYRVLPTDAELSQNGFLVYRAPSGWLIEVTLARDCAQPTRGATGPVPDPCGWRHSWYHRVQPDGTVTLLYDEGDPDDA
jgi:hypothetical protein